MPDDTTAAPPSDTQGPRLDAKLLKEYRDTDYWIGSEPPLVVQIDQTSAEAAALLARLGVASAVSITAWNPFSQLLSEDDNAARQDRLRTRLEALGLRWMPAAGRDRDQRWPEERGLFVPGVDAALGTALLDEFEQNALVFLDSDGHVSLQFHPALTASHIARVAREAQ